MTIQYFEQLHSTNTYLKEHLSLPHQTAICADVQTAGKGRLGRQWETPKGNVSVSILLHQPKGDFSLYPLLCAMAVATLLERYTNKTVGIKWPNDIVLDGKKICGILCESVISSQVSVICGIGINVNFTQEQLTSVGLPYGTSLSLMTEKQYDTRSLAAELMALLCAQIEAFEQAGFGALKQQYEAKLVNLQQRVQVLYQGKTVEAVCLGVADNGNLICENETGRFIVHSGEASVRGLYGYV